MGYQEAWDEITAHPDWESLPAATRAKVARKYAAKYVRKEVKGNSDQMKSFIQKNVFDVQDAGKPKAQDRGLLREFASEVKNNGLANAATFGKEMVRGVVDTNPVGLARRATGAVADAAYDVIAKPVGLPSAKQIQKAQGREGGRLLPRDPESEQSIPGIAGQIAAGFVDPINLALPLNALGKAAPVASKGINLLPKAAAPSVTKSALLNALGAGATNATVAAPLSAAGQMLDTGTVDPAKTALDVGLSGGVGLVMGGAAPVLRRALDARLARQAEEAGQVRIAQGVEGRPVPGAPGTVNNQTLQAIEEAQTLAQAPEPLPAVSDDVAEAILTRQQPADIETFMRAERASEDYLRPSAELKAPTPSTFPAIQPPSRRFVPKTDIEAPSARTEDEATAVLPTPQQSSANEIAQLEEQLFRLKMTADTYKSNYSGWGQAKYRDVLNKAQPLLKRRNDLLTAQQKASTPAAPPPRSLKALVSEEEGALTLDTPQAQAVGDALGTVAEGAGKAYKTVTDAYTKGIDTVIKKTPLQMGLDKAKEVKAWLKTGETDSPLLQGYQKYFTSNQGVSRVVLRMADDAAREAHHAATPMRKQARALLETLNPQQQADLEKAITEPNLRGGLVDKIARELKQPKAQVGEMLKEVVDESTRLTSLLKEVGAVTEDGAARWEGQYLPRTYEKHFPTISRFFKKSKTLVGKKGRGIEQEVAPSSVPELQAQGWEFRGEVNGKARMWRDYTLEERLDMEQVFHASNAMSKMAQEFERDFANGRLLSDIAKGSDDKGAFALPITKELAKNGPPAGYVEMKSINASSPGTGIKKWGHLANHYVREDVAHYLKWTMENREALNLIKTWTGTNLWKRFKTIWNPAHYVNNFVQNIPTLELAGGSAGDLPRAFKEVSTNGELFQQLEQFGTVKTGQVAQDLALALEGQTLGTGSPVDALSTAMRVVKNLEARGGDLAQATDDLFKVAFVQAKMDGGMPFEEAARLAEKTFYNPQAVTAPAAQVMEAVGLPFARVLFYQIDKISDQLLENPAKAIALTSYFLGAKALVDAYNGTTTEQQKARDTLVPDHLKKPFGYLPTPLKDSKGNDLILNTGNWSPVGFLDTADQVSLPLYPSALMPGGPAVIGAQALFNHDVFRNKPIRTAVEDGTGRFLLENLGPGVVGRAGTLGDALAGRQSYSGLPYDVPTAAAGLAGLKLQPYSPELGLKGLVREFEKDKTEITGQIRYLAAMAEQNPQDAEAHQKEIDRLMTLLETKAADFEKKLEMVEPGLER